MSRILEGLADAEVRLRRVDARSVKLMWMQVVPARVGQRKSDSRMLGYTKCSTGQDCCVGHGGQEAYRNAVLVVVFVAFLDCEMYG